MRTEQASYITTTSGRKKAVILPIRAATKQDLQLALAETKSELIRWVVGAGFLQTALITALLLKLVK